MEFVNSIAHIVHTSVAMHGGAANKNIGDAFLMVGPLPGVLQQCWLLVQWRKGAQVQGSGKRQLLCQQQDCPPWQATALQEGAAVERAHTAGRDSRHC